MEKTSMMTYEEFKGKMINSIKEYLYQALLMKRKRKVFGIAYLRESILSQGK